MAKDSDTRTYLGPASQFQEREGGPIKHIGDEVTLTDAQVESLTRLGHQFDPPWQRPTPEQAAGEETTV